MKNEFIEVYCCAIIKDIKKYVRKKIKFNCDEVQDFSGNRAEKTDKKMYRILTDLCSADNNSSFLVDFDSFKKKGKIKKELMKYLILYYTALYFDNVDLLKTLLKGGFSFGKKNKKLLLCALDSDISSAFCDSEYLEILGRANHVFEPFYKSISEDSYKDRKKYIARFANILKKRQDLDYSIAEGSLTKEALDMFEDETYLKVDDSQLSLISDFGLLECPLFKEEKNIKRLNKIMQESDFCYSFIEEGEELFNYMTDEEIKSVSCEMGEALTEGVNVGVAFERLKGLYESKPDLVDHVITYNKSFLDRFSDEDICTFPEEVLSKFSKFRNYYFPEGADCNEERIITLLRVHGVKLDKNDGIKQKVKFLLGGSK